MCPEDLELLITREMPFGKHKGTLIADLPGNYLNWYAREGFPQGEIGRQLACRLREQEMRKLAPVPGSNLKGRPTKREGRLIRGMQ